MLYDTITAIATPLGVGGIGVIRISGSDSLSILESIFISNKKCIPNYVSFGVFCDPKTKQHIDEGCAVFFKGPKSYTGEDVVEISSHGSPLILKKLLDTILSQGARLAERGEFTKRAFCHGKIDLIKAESVIDLIHANSEVAKDVALNRLEGALYNHIQAMRATLIRLLEHMEGAIDFPDEIEALSSDVLLKEVGRALAKLKEIINIQDFGEMITSKVHCLIIGKPNVGKSSLLNKLIGKARVLVSNIPGTTRDYVEIDMAFQGILFNMIDTAGFRQTKGKLENLGIRQLNSLIKKAHVVLWVCDSSRLFSAEDEMIYEKIKQKEHIIIVKNKSDKISKLQLKEKSQKERQMMDVSAKTGQGLDDLKRLLAKDIVQKLQDVDIDVICNVRQLQCIKNAYAQLKELKKHLNKGFEDDLLTIDLKRVILSLSEITGDEVTEEVLDGIFSRFCVGK